MPNCSYEGCKFDAEPEKDKCIFHLNSDQKDPLIFMRHFANYLKAMRSTRQGMNLNLLWVDQTEYVDGGLFSYYRSKYDYPIGQEIFNFEGFIFPEYMDLSNVTFEKYTSFNKSVFTKGVCFINTIFRGIVSFEDAIIYDKGDFNNVLFNDDVKFSGVNFKNEALAFFSGCRFIKNAPFVNAVFNGSTSFERVVFNGDSIFVDAIFHKEVSFYRAIFQNAYFSNSKYLGLGLNLFNECNFNLNCNFDKSLFMGDVDYSRSSFNHVADFSLAEFNGIVSFQDCYFNTVTFKKSTFNSVGKFIKTNSRWCYFQNIQTGINAVLLFWDYGFRAEGECLKFEDMDVDKISFLHTEIFRDYPLIRFFNVKWGKVPSHFLFDSNFVLTSPKEWMKIPSLLPLKEMKDDLLHTITNLYAMDMPSGVGNDFAKKGGLFHQRVIMDVERVANEIRRFYEVHGSYPDAGDFYIGEMGFKRRRIRGFNKFVLYLYWLFSRYGESPRRAVCWILALVAISSIAYLYSGLQVGDKTIQYLFKWNLSKLFPYLGDLGVCLIYAITGLIPTFRTENIMPLSWIFRWGEAFFGTSFIALFLLSLRRRFKR